MNTDEVIAKTLELAQRELRRNFPDKTENKKKRKTTKQLIAEFDPDYDKKDTNFFEFEIQNKLRALLQKLYHQDPDFKTIWISVHPKSDMEDALCLKSKK